MTALPSLSGRELIAALSHAGFHVLRVKGSHHFLRHADGRTTVIPVHGAEDIGPGLLMKILRDCDISRDHLHVCYGNKPSMFVAWRSLSRANAPREG